MHSKNKHTKCDISFTKPSSNVISTQPLMSVCLLSPYVVYPGVLFWDGTPFWYFFAA